MYGTVVTLKLVGVLFVYSKQCIGHLRAAVERTFKMRRIEYYVVCDITSCDIVNMIHVV